MRNYKKISEPNTKNLKNKAVKGAGINLITNWVGFLFRSFSVIILARLLEPKDFGVVTMVTVFSLLPMNFGLNGFTEYIIQKKSIDKIEINAIFWVHLFFSLFLALCFFGFSFFIVKFYSEPKLTRISAAISITFILVSLYTTPMALLKRHMKFKLVAISQFSAEVLSITFAITAAFYGMGYWAVVIRQISIPFVIVIAIWFFSSWRPNTPCYFHTAWPGFQYAVKVFCNFSVGYFRRNIDKILLGKFGGTDRLGFYDRAYYLSTMPVYQLLRPLNAVALATLSRLQHDKKRYIIYFTKALSMVSLIGTAAAIILMLIARDIVPMLLGSGWNETGRILMALSPGIASTMIYGTHSWLHLSLGTPGKWLRWNIVSTLITVIIFVIAAPHGSVAIAVAYSVINYVLFLPALWYAGRPVELKIIFLLKNIWQYFTAGILIAVIWLYLPNYWQFYNNAISRIGPLGRIMLTVSVVPFIYIGALSMLQRNFSSIREVISLVKIVLRKSPQNA